MVLHPLEEGREVLKFFREYNRTTPDEMSTWAALLTSPDGHPMVAILACYVGSSEIHIALGGMYLIPIIAAALWFGLRGALATTIVISLAYYAHIRLSRPNQPMENANQFAMIIVYWVVGTVAGTLVNLEERGKGTSAQGGTRNHNRKHCGALECTQVSR